MRSIKSIIRSSPLLIRTVVPLYRVYQETASELPKYGPMPLFIGESRILAHKFRSKQEYYASDFGVSFAERKIKEDNISNNRHIFSHKGYCAICGIETNFAFNSDFSQDEKVNWRESGFCLNCRLSARMRGAIHCLLQEFSPPANADIYISEKFTPAYRWLKGRFQNLVGSEYIKPGLPSGTLVRKVRHEDLQHLSFRDESIGYLLSFEVLEHVPHLELATAEIARVLRPGGRLFFSAPFRIDSEVTITRAVLDEEGNVRHMLPAEIHGNPADPVTGALCYRHFGWNYLEILKEAGFINPEVITFWSDRLGYMAQPVFITAVRG